MNNTKKNISINQKDIEQFIKDLDNDHALSLWIVADQLMKGAAYNSIDIGLKMIEMELI